MEAYKNPNSNNKHRYNLASATSRLFSKFFDIVLVLLFNTGIYFIIFNNESNSDFPIWKFFVFCLSIFLSFFIYFIVIPFFSAGYTLFSKAFKIRIYSVTLRTITARKWLKHLDFVFFVQLIIREIFTWGLFAIITLLLGIISFIWPNEIREFLNDALKNVMNNSKNTSNPIEIIFTTLYSIAALVDFVLIMNIAIMSKKRSFNDHMSNTVVIKMVDVFGGKDPQMPLNTKNRKENVKYNLPGEVNFDELLKDGDHCE